MKSIRKHVLGFAFGVFVLFATVALLPNTKAWWLRLSGAVKPSGSRIMSYSDKPIRILSATGERWSTSGKLEDASAYHVLVILPSVPVSNRGGLSGGDSYNHRLMERWLMRRNEEKEVDTTYDALWQTVTVNSQTYSLSNGNLFVVRFSENADPKVRQINATINNGSFGVDEFKRLTDAFKAALPECEVVQQL